MTDTPSTHTETHPEGGVTDDPLVAEFNVLEAVESIDRTVRAYTNALAELDERKRVLWVEFLRQRGINEPDE